MPAIYVTKKTRQRKNRDGSNAPQPTCEVCKVEIAVGMPHKNVSVRSGSFSRVRVRCMDEPNWHSWELSDALWARLEEVSYNFHAALSDGGFETVDDVRGALEEAASSIREIAEEKRESAQNIEDGFGHETYQSDELTETADSLDSWADEIEGVNLPDYPEPVEDDCRDCGASGFETTYDGRTVGQCGTCKGSGRELPEEPTEGDIQVWRDEVEEAIAIVDESPL